MTTCSVMGPLAIEILVSKDTAVVLHVSGRVEVEILVYNQMSLNRLNYTTVKELESWHFQR